MSPISTLTSTKSELVADTAALDDFNRNVVEEFRANGGKVGGRSRAATLVLLHTTGRQAGQPRLSPLAYLDVDDKMLIVGSTPVHRTTRRGCTICGPTQGRVEVGTDAYDAAARGCPPTRATRRTRRSSSERAPAVRRVSGQDHPAIPLFELAPGV